MNEWLLAFLFTQAVEVPIYSVALNRSKSERRLGAPLFPLKSMKIHGSLRVTPVMAAGVAERVWGLEELLKTA